MPGKFRFGMFELDDETLELCKKGVRIRLQEQPLRVLALLAARPGELITREELQQKIWGHSSSLPPLALHRLTLQPRPRAFGHF